jgi:hypothetical protein
MITEKFHVTPKSSNAKTGDIVVTTSTATTCPPACPLKKECYAKSGPLALHWGAVTKGSRGSTWEPFLDDLERAVRKAPAGQVWRLNQAGDLPGSGNTIDGFRLLDLVSLNARSGGRGFTYTHKPILAADALPGSSGVSDLNLALIRHANRAGFTVNLSANSLEHADRIIDTTWRTGGRLPVVVLLPSDAPASLVTPGGRRVVTCPAQLREGVTCKTCRLCSRSDRSVVVGFRAHGSQAKGASRIAQATA